MYNLGDGHGQGKHPTFNAEHSMAGPHAPALSVECWLLNVPPSPARIWLAFGRGQFILTAWLQRQFQKQFRGGSNFAFNWFDMAVVVLLLVRVLARAQARHDPGAAAAPAMAGHPAGRGLRPRLSWRTGSASRGWCSYCFGTAFKERTAALMSGLSAHRAGGVDGVRGAAAEAQSQAGRQKRVWQQ